VTAGVQNLRPYGSREVDSSTIPASRPVALRLTRAGVTGPFLGDLIELFVLLTQQSKYTTC